MASFEEELKELNQRNEEKIQLAIKKISSMIPGVIGILISLWWLFYGALKIEKFSFGVIVSNLGLVI